MASLLHDMFADAQADARFQRRVQHLRVLSAIRQWSYALHRRNRIRSALLLLLQNLLIRTLQNLFDHWNGVKSFVRRANRLRCRVHAIILSTNLIEWSRCVIRTNAEQHAKQNSGRAFLEVEEWTKGRHMSHVQDCTSRHNVE